MKKTFKKLICMILCFAMIFTTLQTSMFSASAKVVGPDNKTELTITADKSKYSWGDTIVFDIEVKNVTSETLTGIRINSFSKNYLKVVQEGDLPVISKLEPGETQTVQVKYIATKLVGAMAIFFPIIWLFSPAARIAYRETNFNYEEKIKIGATKYRVGFEVEYGVSNDDNFDLKASENEIEANSKSNTIYFYAQPPIGFDYVELIDCDSNEVIATMLDDGKYSISGDDIPNDGVFSAKLIISSNIEVTRCYRATAKTKSNGSDIINSNQVDVFMYTPLTGEQIKKMNDVDDIISNLVTSSAFKNATENGRENQVNTILNDLINDNLVRKNSIYFDNTSKSFSFTYIDGFIGGVSLNEFSDDLNSTNTTSDTRDNVIVNQIISNSDIKSSNLEIGDALFLHSFEHTPYRTGFYNETKYDWDSKGLDTTVNMDVTVTDFKSIDSKFEIIFISGHGSTYNDQSVICTDESVTDSNRVSYSSDIKQNRIVPVTLSTGEKRYWIFPEFFEHYYDNNDLKNSFIFSECCCFFGQGDIHSDAFANVFLECGAKAVVGFYNSVLAGYSRDFMKTCVDQLILGETIDKAFNKAASIHGKDDGKKNGAVAIPNLRGDLKARLIETAITNGSFELSKSPVYWNYEGDVRIIQKLGDLKPQDGNKMAILTTGLGSMESKYLEGTEGSFLQQTFTVPQNAKTLSFKYDVVSEEPDEYVGSEYDDKFLSVIYDVNGNSEQIVFESINESKWEYIEGINFEKGDNTTYHTGWKTIKMDISKYAGKTVSLKFVVYDVGDSYYDTAALIDSISIGY